LPVIAHADGSIKFQGKTMKIDEFTAKIKEAATANPNLAVIIHSNPKMDYAKFEAVVDACKNAPAKEVDVVPPAPQPPAAPAAPVTAETPPATNAAPETPAPPAVNEKPVPAEIDLAADGSLTLDGSAVTEDELKAALTTLKKSNPKNPLVMMKAPGVTKDQWTHYVDLCHSLGLKLLVKNAKGPAVVATPKVEAPAALRPPAAEGGSTELTPTPTPETPATNAAPVISANEEAVPVEIELTPDGQVSFLGEAVTEDELKARLANVAQNNTKEPVVIVKDEKVTHDQLQHVVDLCHQAKLKVKIKTVKSSDMGALKPRVNLPVVLAPAPPASGDNAMAKVLPIEIGLGTKGRLTFEGQSVSLDELKDRLATVAKGNPNQPVVILKQPDVSDDSADALMTVCQGVSAQLKISVKTAPSFTPPSLPDNSPADNLHPVDGLRSASAVIP
jgi:biopolymer transport protein ExbD